MFLLKSGQMKFFKNIFVFTFAITAIFFVSRVVSSNVVWAAVANIDRIVFFTPERNVSVGQISEVITIQVQNSGGGEEKLDESTNKVLVTVTSSTGEFNSNSTTWSPTDTFTMNKNTANKNFYYKDSSAGTYIITAKLTTGETGKSWTATQNITVGGSGGSTGGDIGDETSTSTATSTATSTTTTTTNNSGGTTVVYSVHYIQEDLSDYEEPTTFEVGAGRARLSYVNSPVSFEAKHKVSKNLSAKNCDYIWNFGDAVSLTGEKVEHIYKYPGEYNVILNGTCGDLKSVARTVVKVVAPSVSISTKTDGAVEIINSGKYEINLYNWKMQSGKNSFIFLQSFT